MLYMAVTDDRYELPCFVADSGREVSERIKIDESYFRKLLKRNRPYKKLKMRFLMIEE